MSKLNALKEKLSGLGKQVSEKADKIALIRKWRAPRAAASAAKPDPASLSAIYREGSTLTRVQVILFLILAAVGIVSAGSLAIKLAAKLKTSGEHEKLKANYAHEFAEVKRKSAEKAEMIALGQFTANAWVGPPKEKAMLSIDLWIKVSDPKAASAVNGRTAVFHDKAMEALNELFLAKVSLLTEEGKARARETLKTNFEKALPHGSSVEDVYIQNLTVQ